MSRFPMKFLAFAFGSSVLVVAAGCERRNDMTTPESTASPSAASQDVNSLRPAPSSAAPGAGGAAAESDMDRMPVSGSEASPLGEGKGGHGGHAGHAGHAGKHGH
jgi:hypothetical protein